MRPCSRSVSWWESRIRVSAEGVESTQVLSLGSYVTLTNSEAIDFQHKASKESLWMNGYYNPIWAEDVLEKIEEQPSAKMPKALKKIYNINNNNGGWEALSLEDALASLEEEILPQPSFDYLLCIVRTCTKERNLAYALRLHAYIQKKGLEAHESLGNYLVSMLVEVGSMHNAQKVFDRLVSRTDYSWNSLINGYIECGDSTHALILYHKMREYSIYPSGHTFVSLLKACAKLKDVEKGSELHTHIVGKGLLKNDVFVGSALVDMYAKCGSLAKAQEVFDELPNQDVVSWNALIAGYAKHECGEEALNCFKQMQLEGLSPNAITFTCILKACGSIGAIDKGREIHAEIVRKGWLKRDLVLGSALVDMYAKCGSLAKAQEVFEGLPVRNVVSWNALIAGYAKQEYGEEALNCFKRMQLEGVSPNAITFICSLKACASIRAINKGIEIHTEIVRKGLLKRDLVLGSTLVDMYVKCGSLAKAQEVFSQLSIRNVVSWNALIAGYVEHERSEEALKCFDQMQLEGVSPNAITYICSLKACGSIGATDKGQEIHSEVARKGFLKRDVFVGSALVDMYAKCGSLVKAQEVFDELPVQNVVVWNALIAGYAKYERGEEALKCLDQMQLEGVSPNAITFTCSLKACGSIGATEKGREIHDEIVRKGLLKGDLLLGSSLVDMYAKCGSLAKAQEVFEELPARNLGAWNALIAGYAKHERGEEALNCFERMQLEGVSPDTVTLICILKACGSVGAINKGREIHNEIERKGLLERDLVVGCALVDMYAKCGLLAKAHQVFDKLPVRNIGSWNALIAGYANQERGEEALNCFEQMQFEGVSPDAITFACSLKACGSIGATDKGSEIHAEIARKGSLGTDFIVGNALVDMYAKCGSLAKAQEVFDKLPKQDVVSWNALIAGYTKHEHGEEALKYFEVMQLKGVSPDAITFASSLKACGIIGAIDKGKEIHAEIEREGLLERDLVVGNALVDMYAKCGFFAKAQDVFEKLPSRDVVSWNALIAGYAKHERGEEALNCFEQMQSEGVSPDAITFACSLKACGSIGATNKGREIHAEVERKGLLERDLVVGNALVDMYAKCGLLAKAQDLFDKLPNRGVVSWNALMAGYAKHMRGEEALICFEQMHLESVTPNTITFACSLKACGSIAATDKGREIHAEIERQGLLERDVVVGNALVDMYAKCGLLAKAKEVFDKLPNQDTVSWNALIAGYAQLGDSESVFRNFDRMTGDGINPNLITFVSVLNACSHAGLVDKAENCFDAMSKHYGITPTVEHHTCMVDLLGRAGQVDRAVAMMKKLPFHPDIVIWCTVLGACRKWGNVELGREAFEQAVQLDEKEAAAYVCMYNIYADTDMQEDGKEFECKTSMEEAMTLLVD